MAVIGLTWVNDRVHWVYCRWNLGGPRSEVEIGTIQTSGAEQHGLLAAVDRIVLDVPIGLPEGGSVGFKYRPCDVGARRWLGPVVGAWILPPPYQAEVLDWNRREADQSRQRRGGFRSRIPAIYAASQIFARYPDKTLESHPELVFAALAGRPLPATANRALFLGTLVRLGLLTRFGLTLYADFLVRQGGVNTESAIDAAALAIVAGQWQAADRIRVIRQADGMCERLDAEPKSHQFVKALPTERHGPDAETTVTADQLTEFANTWLTQNIFHLARSDFEPILNMSGARPLATVLS